MRNEHLPRVIAWETTRRCALRCKHCRGSARDEDYSGELSTAECLKVIDSIAAFAKPILILTGGEPMVREDIYTLARRATDVGMRVVMAPCGHLITPETAQKLKDAGVMAISISIDGATPEAHDAFRGVPGAYARTIEGLQHAIAAGIPFQVNTTVTRDNVEDLPAIHDLAVSLGASKFDVFFLVPTGRGSALRDLALSPTESEDALKWVLEKSRTSPMSVKLTCAPHSVRIWEHMGEDAPAAMPRGGGHPGGHPGEVPGGHGGGRPAMSPATGCMAGDGFVFISHTGILQPCGFLDVPSGDLRSVDFDFQRAYRESAVFASLWDTSGYEGKCGACEFVHSCGGCRARAYAKTGDYLKAEPGCSYVPEVLRRQSAASSHHSPSGAHNQTMTDQNHNAWMTAVQRDIPLERRPFAVIGARFDMTEDAVITKIKTLFDEGKARRIGGVFDVRGVGYRSALCAATVPDAELERTAALLTPEAGMTHCYQRGWPEALGRELSEAPPAGIPNLWFTLSAQGDAFDVKIAAIRETLSPAPFFVMPAVRHFKIDVVFDVGGSERSSEVSTPAAVEHSDAPPAVFSESDRALIRAMQGLIPLTPAPYDEIAVTLGLDPDAVLDRLRAWKAAGILRRVGIILRHRKLGFSANGMCVWRAMPDSIENAGKTLATFRDVTHCYEREVIPGFPYNLFAMIHAGSYEEALAKFHKLSDAAGLDDGRVLFSMREFKKTSPRYFCEDL